MPTRSAAEWIDAQPLRGDAIEGELIVRPQFTKA
jgi:hypothetical protein